MKSRIKFTVEGNGNIISDITEGNDKIFQGQVAATEYYLYADEMTSDKWLSNDKVYINLTRPDNRTSQVAMDRADGCWVYTSNGWETDVDISDISDLTISFTMRRYSRVDETTLIATKPTSEVTKTIYPTTGYVPQEIESYNYYLRKDNTTEFNPTGDYNPATKKYVDDILRQITIADTGTVTQTLSPNIYYNFTGFPTTLTLTLGTEVSDIRNEYAFEFVANADGTTLTAISGVAWVSGTPIITAGKKYQMSILNGIGVFVEI